VSAVEIRPGVADDMSCYLLMPDREPGLDRCTLVVDRSAGTATWTGDGYRMRRAKMRLGLGAGELAEVVRAVSPYVCQGGLWGRLLLVDGNGRVLARSLLAPQEVLEQFWPLDAFDGTGLPVRAEEFRNTRLLQRAHPGAAPAWPFTAGYFWLQLACLVSTGALLGLIALVVVLTGWPA